MEAEEDPKGAEKGVSRVQAELMAKAAGWGASQEVKKEPEKGLEAHWEAQWQDFLERLQPDLRRWEEPMVSDAALWDDAKAFLASFEQVAQACQWPRGEWAARLLPALNGLAEEAFGSLETQDKGDYGKVKAAILRAEALRMEKERQHFRHFSCPEEVGDPRRLHSQLQELCHRWLRPERHSKEQILELLILEQFLASLPSELQGWIRAGGPGTCSQAVALAEDFLRSQEGADRTELQGLTIPKEVYLPLLKGDQDPTQPSNQTIFWEVLQENGGNIDSLDDSKGSQVKMEKSPWGGHEPVDIPGTATQASNVTLLKRVEISAEGYGPTEDPAAESDTECKEFRDHLTATVCHPSKILMKGNPTSAKSDQQYPCKSGPDRRRTKGKHNESAMAEGTLQQNPYSDKQQGVTKDTVQPKLLGSVEGDQDSHKSGENQRIQSEGRQSEHSLCGKRLLQRRNVMTHRKPNTDVMPYKCHQCGKCFSRRRNLNTHQQTHTRAEPHKCYQCGKCFSLGKDLKRHQDIHAGAIAKLHKCSQCGKSFCQRQVLKIHQRIHTGEKPYKCSQCGKCFSQQGHLMSHWVTHTGEKPHTCPECGKSFQWNSQLRIHQVVHTGDRAYRCTQCGKCFYQGGDLNRHLRIHTGEKPYECPDCGKNFSRREYLNRHLRIHTGEKPFQCPECGENFYRRDRLSKHQRTHSVETLQNA